MTIFYVFISLVSDQYFDYINWSDVSLFLNFTFLCVCPLCDINYSTVCITVLHVKPVIKSLTINQVYISIVWKHLYEIRVRQKSRRIGPRVGDMTHYVFVRGGGGIS